MIPTNDARLEDTVTGSPLPIEVDSVSGLDRRVEASVNAQAAAVTVARGTSPTTAPPGRRRILAGGVLWCGGWAALAASAVLPAVGGAPQAVTWALVAAATGMTVLALAPAGELSVARPLILAAPASAAGAWVPTLASMPLWLVTGSAAVGMLCCACMAGRLAHCGQAHARRPR